MDNIQNHILTSNPSNPSNPSTSSNTSTISPTNTLPVKKRSRSKKACLICGQRKVKCNVTTKNYPLEKCSNCEEYGIECIVPQRKRRKTKKEVEAERNEIKKQLNLKKQISLPSSDGKNISTPTTKTANTISTPIFTDTNPSNLNYENQQSQIDPFTKLKGDEILIDPDIYLSKVIDPNKLARFLQSKTSNTLVKLSIPISNQNQIVSLRDLISDECLITLKSTGCFILPSIKNCELYIDAFFKCHNMMIPVISISVFKKEFKDLRNPASLLLIRSLLYVGAKIIAKTPEEFKQARILYEKAKLVLNSFFEIDGIYLTLSYIILECPPCDHPSAKDIESSLKSALDVAISFGMHKNVEDSNYLSIEEKRMYKRMFTFLIIKDRGYALTFSKNFNILLSNCTVKPLTYDDLNDTGAPNQKLIFQFFKDARNLQIATDKITGLQKNASIAAIQNKPFLKFSLQMEKIMNDLVDDRPPVIHDKNYIFFPFLYDLCYYTLQIFIQRVNFYRIYSVFMRCCDSKNNQPNILTLDDFNHCETAWFKIAYSIHNSLISIHDFVPKIKQELIYTQNTVFLIFQAATAALPYLFHKDKKIRDMMINDLVSVIPILEDLRSLVSWNFIDSSYFVLKHILPNPRKLVNYCRSQINANDCEITSKLSFKASFVSLNIKKRFVPPFLPPIINIKLSEFTSDTRLGANEHLKKNEYICWINTPIPSTRSGVKFDPIPRIIVKSYKNDESDNTSSIDSLSSFSCRARKDEVELNDSNDFNDQFDNL